MPFAAEIISDDGERVELEQMTQSRTLPAGDVFGARLILVLAEGVPYRIMQEQINTTISRWEDRFAAAYESFDRDPTSRAAAICDFAGAAGQGIGVDPTQAER